MKTKANKAKPCVFLSKDGRTLPITQQNYEWLLANEPGQWFIELKEVAEPPLPLWVILVTILGGLLLMLFVAGLMFQSAVEQGLR